MEDKAGIYEFHKSLKFIHGDTRMIGKQFRVLRTGPISSWVKVSDHLNYERHLTSNEWKARKMQN